MSVEPIASTDLNAIAERIRQRIQQATSDIIETGKDLLLVKERLSHGEFYTWINAEFGMSPRSAQRFMNVAEWTEGKSDTVTHLAPTALYALAAKSTPEPIRAQVIEDLEAGKRVKPREVTERVKMARAEQRLERHQQALRDDKNLRRSKPFRERRAREEQKREKRREREIERKVATATEVIQLLRKLPAEDFDRLSELMSDVGMLWHVHDLLESAKLELPHGEPEAKPAEPPLVKCLKTVRRNVESAMRELPPEEWVDLLRRLRGEIDDIDEKEIGDHGHHAERQSD